MVVEEAFLENFEGIAGGTAIEGFVACGNGNDFPIFFNGGVRLFVLDEPIVKGEMIE